MAVGSVTLSPPRAAPAFDGPLLAVGAVLVGLGLVMMASASVHLHGGGLDFAVRQALHLALGVALAWVAWRLPLRLWQRLGPLLLLLGLAALVAVKVPGIGVTVNGSTRWLDLGGMRLQVSAPFKLVAMIYLAGYLVRHGETLRREPWALLRPLGLLGLGAGLLLWEPDFGAAAVLLAAAVALLFLAGARLLPLLGLLTLLAAGAVLLVVFEPYRMKRVIGFLDPWAHARDEGYQLVQALIAFGRGGPFGVGLGNSVQKMFYLPEGHTDFILAVIGEELGWVGVAGILTAFGLLLWRIFRTADLAARAGDAFGTWLAYGIGLLLGLTVLINVGVNLGVLPTKGLPLPLISYGGSGLLCDLLALGLVQRIHAEARETLAATPGRKPWRG